MTRRTGYALLASLLLLLCACGGSKGGGTTAVTPVTTPLTITTSTIPDAVVGTAYSAPLQSAGAVGTVTWSIVSGALAPGLSLNGSTGLISGTPTTSGTYNFTLQATTATQQAQQALTHRVATSVGLTITTPATLTAATAGAVYSQALQAGGGVPPYTWTMTGDPNQVLPPGLAWNNGLISGIPTGSGGTFTFAAAVSDSAVPPTVAARMFTVSVAPAPFAITTAALPGARVGAAFRVTLGTTPVSGTVQWSASGMPAGMSIDPVAGAVSWLPNATGTFSFSVHAAVPATGASADRSYTVTVVGATAAARNDAIASATPLSNGLFRASLSPYADSAGNAAPDHDYYKITALGGATVEIETFAARLTDVQSEADTAIEILDGNGRRHSTCRDPADDAAIPGVPIVLDVTPNAYDDGCINDDYAPGNTDSRLSFRVPGPLGQPVTFYVHVLDWRGDARPDFIYELSISGAQ